MAKNYRLKFGAQEDKRLEYFKRAVAKGERRELTADEMADQHEYRKAVLARGRVPKSYEKRIGENPMIEVKRKLKLKKERMEEMLELKKDELGW